MALDETQRKAVRPDDVLDALVAFVTANSRSELSVLGNSATDERGLPMEMVHVAPNTGPRTV
jgi:predicted RNase H-like nuclease